MKIDGNAPQIDPRALDRLEKSATRPAVDAPSGPSQDSGGTDQVRLSSEAQLVHAAAEAARHSPGIRQNLVEKMRALLIHDELGNNPERLADALIEHWLAS